LVSRRRSSWGRSHCGSAIRIQPNYDGATSSAVSFTNTDSWHELVGWNTRHPQTGPMFFVGAWVLMIFAGIVYKDLGVHPFGYVSSMVVSIGLWLTMAPAMGAVARVSGPKHKNR
jgi:hypothetical protein